MVVSRGASSTVQLAGLLISLLLISTPSVQPAKEVFTNTFYVQLKGPHGAHKAHEIAKRSGFENLGSVSIRTSDGVGGG